MQMIPGVLDRRLAIKPMTRVSPRRYDALKQCTLREVWAAGGQPHLLPVAPAARLGTAIHQLLEDAGRGRLASAERPAVERRWEELLGEAERTMRASWLERHFVPLRSSVPGFEVRQLRAQERALAIAQAAARASREPGQDQAMAGFEKWVAAPDGSVGGYIDHVVESPGGLVLRDYKSGSIHDATVGLPPAAVRESFVVQMRLYAALYAATTGSWPAKLELVPLHGDGVEIPFDAADCEALLAEAIAALAHINSTIAEPASQHEDAEARLANPSIASCRQCLFRPACAPYRQARTEASSEEEWPDDVWGELRRARQLGNGKLLLTISTGLTDREARHIRGITASPERHPALQHVHEGCKLSIFSLRGAAAAGTLSETPWTVIYKMDGSEDG
jgi:RecB family exonuclease